MEDGEFDPDDFSLLFPPGYDLGATPLAASAVRDLELDRLVKSLAPNDQRRRAFFEKVLFSLPRDPELVRARQDIFEDLSACPELSATFKRILPRIDMLASLREVFMLGRREKESLLQSVSWRLSILENYLACIDQIRSLEGKALKSALIRLLIGHCGMLDAQGITRSCRGELPKLRKSIENARSFTLGVNLDACHNPVGVTLLSVNEDRFEKDWLVNKLFSGAPMTDNPILRLYKNDAEYPPLDIVPGTEQEEILKNMNLALRPLFEQVSKMMHSALQPVDSALRRYATVNTTFLSNIRHEIDFYLSVHDLFAGLRSAGLPACRPALLGREARRLRAEGGVNLNLALRKIEAKEDPSDIVRNGILMDDAHRICILTGPNHGGKTTYIEMAGVIQLCAQAGLPVPCESAEVSLVDSILTHYQGDEKPDAQLGRFGEEAARFKEIADAVTPCSLVLMNESFSSTHAGEAFYIAKDILSVFRSIGTSVVFATHLHNLAEQAEAINAERPELGNRLVSLVSEVVEGADGMSRTYRIVESYPKGKSYATDIARHYKIDYHSMMRALSERGIAGAG